MAWTVGELLGCLWCWGKAYWRAGICPTCLPASAKVIPSTNTMHSIRCVVHVVVNKCR